MPTRDEAGSVGPLVAAVRSALGSVPYELLFVDDSRDDTPARLAALAEGDPRLRVFHRPGGGGLASAVTRGFEEARGRVLAVLDADLQHPPAVLLPLLEAVEAGAGLAIASRFAPGGSDGGLGFWRKGASWLARLLAWACVPPARAVSDPTSGCFALRRSALADAPLAPLGWKIALELLARAPVQPVVEVPYAFAPRAAGRSKLGAGAALAYLAHLRALRRAVAVTAPAPRTP